MSFAIRELRLDDNCKTIKLGNADHAPLKTFFAKDAKQLQPSAHSFRLKTMTCQRSQRATDTEITQG